jgi:alcohol dehydrogenase YqhD (iron-dependent ADH family)
MINFEFNNPTKILFGKDMELNVYKELINCGATKVLLHYGGNSAKKSGLLDRVISSLEGNNIQYISLGGVVPNPRLDLVHEGIALCKQNDIDFILAVGGGSVIDSAKAIAMGALDDGEVWDFFIGKRKLDKVLPIGTILTIPAAGSEASVSTVITKEDEKLKLGFSNTLLYPRFSILNPELALSLPSYQVSCGAVDMMMHTFERYFCTTKSTDLIDRMSEGLLISIIRNATVIMKTPNDYDAMSNLMWAGTLAHNGVLGTGKDSDWATHALEHELSAIYDVAHGAGLAVVWPSWARYVYKENIDKFVAIAVNVWGVSMDFENPKNTALEGIRRTELFFSDINMPINIKQLGIDDPDIDTMAKKCAKYKNSIGVFKKLNEIDMKNIYEMAK